jgi:hypothetical protein
MSGAALKRSACVFFAVVIMGPAFQAFGKSLTDNRVLVVLFAAIGGALGLLFGVALDNYLFGRRR